MNTQTGSMDLRPLWARYLKPVRDRQQEPGEYDDSRDVWVVPGHAGPQPAVLTQAKKSTRTVTSVRREATDTD